MATWLTAGLFLMALAAPTASGQPPAAEGEVVPEGVGVLYFTATETQTGSSINAGDTAWYGMVPEAPAEDAEPAKVYAPRSLLALTYTNAWGFEHIAGQAMTVDGEVMVRAVLGCDNPVVFRNTDAAGFSSLGFELQQEGDDVASTRVSPDSAVCFPGDEIVVEAVLAVDGVEFDEGDLMGLEVLQWTSNFLGGSDPGRSLYLLVGDPANPSFIAAPGLPSAGGEAEAVEEFVHRDAVSEEFRFDETTNATFVHHWDHRITGDVEISYEGHVEAGNVSFQVLDGDNETVLNATVDESVQVSEVVEDVTPGNWTIRTSFESVRGTFAFDLGPFAEPSPMANETTPAAEGNESTPTGNGTTQEFGDDEQAIPASGAVVALVAALAAVAWAARRKPS